jgi:hypothetical protein
MFEHRSMVGAISVGDIPIIMGTLYHFQNGKTLEDPSVKSNITNI